MAVPQTATDPDPELGHTIPKAKPPIDPQKHHPHQAQTIIGSTHVINSTRQRILETIPVNHPANNITLSSYPLRTDS